VRHEGVAAGRPQPDNPFFFLETESVRDVKAKCEGVLRMIEEWGDVAGSIDYQPGKAQSEPQQCNSCLTCVYLCTRFYQGIGKG
jgi:TPP-dependent indolepyruvate ferredoxin oxidoreductase alpha subunit